MMKYLFKKIEKFIKNEITYILSKDNKNVTEV